MNSIYGDKSAQPITTVAMEGKDVPRCCLNCPFFEYPEYDYDGGLWALPYCRRGLWLPVKKLSCKVKDKETNGLLQRY